MRPRHAPQSRVARHSPRGTNAVKPRPDPTNLDSVAYTIVGLGVVGWLLTLLLH
jgi:hypothetical protein